MSSDPPDAPADPRAAAAYEVIAERARRRSTQTQQLADLAALEVCRLHGLPDESAPVIAVLLAGYLRRAVDTATLALSGELARVGAEVQQLRAQAIAQGQQLERVTAQLAEARRQVLRRRSEER